MRAILTISNRKIINVSMSQMNKPWTLNLGPWTVNREPWTVDLEPWTLNLEPCWSLLTGNWEAVDNRHSNEHLHYFINVCRPYNPPPQEISCPGGAIGACQFDHKTGRGHNMGYVQSNPQIAANGDLALRYLGGDMCHNQFNRSTRIIFSCSKTMVRKHFVIWRLYCRQHHVYLI